MHQRQSNFLDVVDFQAKFGVPMRPFPSFPHDELVALKLQHLEEELKELTRAAEERNLAELADGLVDLVYVAMGFAASLGLPWQALWDAVHAANMAKERAQRASDSKRGSVFDVVKPEGWTPPDIAGILRRTLMDYIDATLGDAGTKL